MRHSQLNVTYPDTPFVYNYDRPNDVYEYVSEHVSKNKFMYELANLGVNKLQTEIDDDNDDNNDININDNDITDGKTILNDKQLDSIDKLKVFLKYISNLDKELNEFEEVRYSITYQNLDGKVRFVRGEKNIWLNLHTQSYDILTGSDVIDDRLDSIVSWCIIPIIGNTRSHKTSTIKYSDISQIYKDNEVGESTIDNVRSEEREKINSSDTTTNSIIDHRGSEKILNNRMERFRKRSFIKRRVEKEEIVRDIIIDREKFEDVSNEKIPMNTNETRIKLNAKTRANAQNIRAALKSKYKIARMKQVPQLAKFYQRADRKIDKVGDTIIRNHNKTIDERIRFLDGDFADYIADTTRIDLVRGIWRFLPKNSGRIIIDINDKNISNIVEEYIEKRTEVVVDKPKDVVSNESRSMISSVPNPVRKFNVKSGSGRSIADIKDSSIDKTPKRRARWIRKKVENKQQEVTGDVCGGPIKKRTIDPDETFTREERDKRKYRERFVKRTEKVEAAKDRIVSNDNIDNNDNINNENSISNTRNINSVNIDGIDIAFITISRVHNVLCLNLNTIKI